MNSSQVKRFFREMCGEYHPTETAPEKRFTLQVGTEEVPVFITKEHIAVYPQIRISPFITDLTYHKHQLYTKSMGDATKGEDPDIEYTRTRTDTNLRQARFQLDIFTKESTLLTKVRDALVSRWDDFTNTDFVELGSDITDWVKDGNIWQNATYDTSFKIIRVSDSSTPLTRCETLADISQSGSWFLDDTGLYVNPLTEIANLTYIEAINGVAFFDGEMASEKGLKKDIKIITSHISSDEDPDISRWIMEVLLKFKDRKPKNVGRTFSVVNVNEPTLK